MPTISGYTEGKEVYAENILSMTCTCVGGNPPATLTWWKGARVCVSVRVGRVLVRVCERCLCVRAHVCVCL